MNLTHSLTRLGSASRSFCLLFVGFAASGATFVLVPAALSVPASAQRGPVQRVVEGKVETKDGAPIKGAVVYLKDEHSQSVRSAISGTDGGFRFVQLAQSTDYEIWAQLDTKRSKSRSISSFDSKASLQFHLGRLIKTNRACSVLSGFASS